MIYSIHDDSDESPYRRRSHHFSGEPSRRDATYKAPYPGLKPWEKAALERQASLTEFAYYNGYRTLKHKVENEHNWEKNIIEATGDLYRKAGIVILDTAGNIYQTMTLDNAGELNNYFNNIMGVVSVSFERSSILTKSVPLTDKLLEIKLQGLTRGLKFAGHVSIFTGVSISLLQMSDKGFSHEAIARFAVDGTITIIGCINPYGLPLGYSAALILGSMNSEGAFDRFYNKFSKTPF